MTTLGLVRPELRSRWLLSSFYCERVVTLNSRGTRGLSNFQNETLLEIYWDYIELTL